MYCPPPIQNESVGKKIIFQLFGWEKGWEIKKADEGTSLHRHFLFIFDLIDLTNQFEQHNYAKLFLKFQSLFCID